MNGEPTTDHLYLDEAGDPTIFARRRAVIIGADGCSRYFIMGKLQVDDPVDLTQKLATLHGRLTTHPYFSGVPSFDPARKKTALAFHAKDDLPEVRFQVMDLLAQEGGRLRFHAVVCDKMEIVKRVQKRNQSDPGYQYNGNELYDELMRSIFGKFHRLADHYKIYIATRGKRDRNQAILDAIEAAESDFESRFGFGRGGASARTIELTTPEYHAPLQAVDYFLWTLQRFYEGKTDGVSGVTTHEDRYMKVLWPQFGEVHDLHFGPTRGTFFTSNNPLTVDVRFGDTGSKRKRAKKMP